MTAITIATLILDATIALLHGGPLIAQSLVVLGSYALLLGYIVLFEWLDGEAWRQKRAPSQG